MFNSIKSNQKFKIKYTKQDEVDEKYEDMQKGLDKFSRLNVKAYMTLLD